MLSLSPLILPDTCNIRRDANLAPSHLSEGYRANFDDKTLAYDVFYRPDLRRGFLVGPRLENLWSSLKTGSQIDGQSVRWKRRKFFRHEELSFSVPDKPDHLSLAVDGTTLSTRIHSAPTLFDGLDCIATLTKDTPADWIVDWLTYHRNCHGVQGALIFDNGSIRYTVDTLQAQLRSRCPDMTIAVVSAPFKYGGKTAGDDGICPPAPMYLQTALLNLMKLKYFAKANGVLNCDIDELVRPLVGGTIFDLARKSRWKAVRFAGEWVYPEGGTDRSHRAHCLRADPAFICPQKWCVVPGSPIGRGYWAVHNVGGELSRFFTAKAPLFWHCRANSTGRILSDDDLPKKLVQAPDLAAAFRDNLPEHLSSEARVMAWQT